ncbi:MAG: DUF1080 domain-containing protein [Verrucomicrobiae bacterium]|nr:DUF1080 domain-containing protein [Verrucomicrobiae bacterium]
MQYGKNNLNGLSSKAAIRHGLFLTITIITAFLFPQFNNSGATSTNWVIETAWKSLFNGKNLDGWTIKCKPEDKDKKIWRVENSEIVADTTNYDNHDYVWLVSNRPYTNFILRLRFKAYKDSPGNSGVQIWSRYDEKTGWMHGPQIDINPPQPWRTGMIWDETKGNQRWICPNLPAGKWVDETMANKDMKFIYSDEGEGWNDLGIVARNGKLKVVLNGVTVNECDCSEILNDNLHKSLGVGSSGIIALQVHTGDKLKIRFKDIRIVEAP